MARLNTGNAGITGQSFLASIQTELADSKTAVVVLETQAFGSGQTISLAESRIGLPSKNRRAPSRLAFMMNRSSSIRAGLSINCTSRLV